MFWTCPFSRKTRNKSYDGHCAALPYYHADIEVDGCNGLEVDGIDVNVK
jgi:hypothetical protein